MNKTLTIELPEELAARLAAVSPEDLNAFAVAVVASVATEDRPAATDPELEAAMREEIKALRPKEVPQWVRDLKPENPGGLASIVGKWPGDETDEEIAAALKELS